MIVDVIYNDGLCRCATLRRGSDATIYGLSPDHINVYDPTPFPNGGDGSSLPGAELVLL